MKRQCNCGNDRFGAVIIEEHNSVLTITADDGFEQDEEPNSLSYLSCDIKDEYPLVCTKCGIEYGSIKAIPTVREVQKADMLALIDELRTEVENLFDGESPKENQS